MYELKLDIRGCTSCGICMDVCPPKAIAMRPHHSRSVEGTGLAHSALNGRTNPERKPTPMMTFPYLAHPQQCDGCRICLRECPAEALTLTGNSKIKVPA